MEVGGPGGRELPEDRRDEVSCHLISLHTL